MKKLYFEVFVANYFYTFNKKDPVDDGNGKFNTVASKKVFNYKNQPLFLDVTVFQS